MAIEVSAEVRTSSWQWVGLGVGGAIATVILATEMMFAFGYASQQLSGSEGTAVAGVIAIVLGAIGPLGAAVVWNRSTRHIDTTAGRIALTELYAGVAGVALLIVLFSLWFFVWVSV